MIDQRRSNEQATKRFEDSPSWQLARDLTKGIYLASKQGAFTKDFGLAGQIQRAAVSVMSNIAEGFERESQAEFAQFLSIAKGSCAEVRSQLYVALDIGYIDQPTFASLIACAERTSRIISGLHSSVKRNLQAERAATQNSRRGHDQVGEDIPERYRGR